MLANAPSIRVLCAGIVGPPPKSVFETAVPHELPENGVGGNVFELNRYEVFQEIQEVGRLGEFLGGRWNGS
jgi:hypothetical protein